MVHIIDLRSPWFEYLTFFFGGGGGWFKRGAFLDIFKQYFAIFAVEMPILNYSLVSIVLETLHLILFWDPGRNYCVWQIYKIQYMYSDKNPHRSLTYRNVKKTDLDHRYAKVSYFSLCSSAFYLVGGWLILFCCCRLHWDAPSGTTWTLAPSPV